jgi:hypothetical protein
MRRGQTTTPEIRKRIRELGLKDDDAGHLVACCFGGLAEELYDNIVGMSPAFNRYEVYRDFEREIHGWINVDFPDYFSKTDFTIVFTIEPRFKTSNCTRHPNSFKYDVEFKVDGQKPCSFTAILNCLCSFC